MKLLDYLPRQTELWNHLKDNTRMMFFKLWQPILLVETISMM